ncbi:MAG: hypothetical protein JOZ62_23095 [Acidobacteriaceae bacterium]|nr:hypothetical protein [Acidobacteriaceae bacterium]
MNDPEIQAIATEAARLWRSGGNIEVLLRFMREKGLSQPESAEPLAWATAIDWEKAHIAVMHSEIWSDYFELCRQLNEELQGALMLLAQECSATVTETELDASFDPETILDSTFSDHAWPARERIPGDRTTT